MYFHFEISIYIYKRFVSNVQTQIGGDSTQISLVYTNPRRFFIGRDWWQIMTGGKEGIYIWITRPRHSGPLYTKPLEWILKWSYRSVIWHTSRQRCCRGECQMSERFEKSKLASCGFESSRDVAIRRLFASWIEALLLLTRYCTVVIVIT